MRIFYYLLNLSNFDFAKMPVIIKPYKDTHIKILKLSKEAKWKRL